MTVAASVGAALGRLVWAGSFAAEAWVSAPPGVWLGLGTGEGVGAAEGEVPALAADSPGTCAVGEGPDETAGAARPPAGTASRGGHSGRRVGTSAGGVARVVTTAARGMARETNQAAPSNPTIARK